MFRGLTKFAQLPVTGLVGLASNMLLLCKYIADLLTSPTDNA